MEFPKPFVYDPDEIKNNPEKFMETLEKFCKLQDERRRAAWKREPFLPVGVETFERMKADGYIDATGKSTPKFDLAFAKAICHLYDLI